MIEWAMGKLFVWGVRVGVLLVACASIDNLLRQWGVEYNLHVPQLFTMGLVLIAVVRLWMPWAPPSKEAKKSFGDVSEM